MSERENPPLVRIITRLNIGGPARQALLLTKELNDTFSTTLVAGESPDFEGEFSDPQVRVRRVSLVRSPHLVNDVKAASQTRSLLEEIRPVLVHTHMAKAGAIGRLVASRIQPRPRIVHTFHGHVLDGYFNSLVEGALVHAERWLAKRADVLIAVSEEVRRELLDLDIGKPEQYRVIPLGLELGTLIEGQTQGKLRHVLGLGPDVPLVGAIGRLAPIKDIPTLLRSIQRIPDVHLAVLGDGPDRTRLEHLTEQLGLTDRVHFLGWWLDVGSALADLDVVALSSRNEGTPVALIEAAAAGRSVVATRVGGVPSVVTDGKNGFLVPSEDPVALAERLESLLRDAPLRVRMGLVGRTEVAPRFASGRLVKDIRELYGQLIN